MATITIVRCDRCNHLFKDDEVPQYRKVVVLEGVDLRVATGGGASHEIEWHEICQRCADEIGRAVDVIEASRKRKKKNSGEKAPDTD